MYDAQLRYERAKTIKRGKRLARRKAMDELVTSVLAILAGFVYAGLILQALSR